MRTTVHIQNLKCGGCEKTIINRLSEVKNISEIEVKQNDETEYRLIIIQIAILKAPSMYFRPLVTQLLEQIINLKQKHYPI